MARLVPSPCSSRRLMAALAAGMLAAAGASADELHVPSQFATIQAAVSAAAPGDTVVVGDGVYTGPGNKDISFAGKAITVRSQSGPAACTIDCQASASNPHRGFVFQSGETAAAVLDGFTIRNGVTANGAVADQFNGGGIMCAGTASPTIRNCVFESNHAGCWGGAFSCSGNTSPTLISCVFRFNSVADDGGAVFTVSSFGPTLINCVMIGNTSGGTGGGLTSFNAAPKLVNCTIIGNSANSGPGLYAPFATLTNCIVRANSGNSAQAMGNGMTVTYSNIQGGAPGAGNIDSDPLFVNAAAGDYRLRAWSPCIDAGSSSALPAAVTTDAAGAPRFHDDSGMDNIGLGLAAVDIGAFEFQGTTCPSDFDHNGVTEPADVAAFVNAWFGSLSAGTLAGDFDHNGLVQPSDIAAFITRWFSGC